MVRSLNILSLNLFVDWCYFASFLNISDESSRLKREFSLLDISLFKSLITLVEYYLVPPLYECQGKK